MPSTKKYRKPRTKSGSSETSDITLITDFNKKSAFEMKKLKCDLEGYVSQYEDRLQMIFHKNLSQIRHMTLKEVMNFKIDDVDQNSETEEYDNDDSPPLLKRFTSNVRPKRCTISDDGYGTASTEKTTSRKMKKNVSKLQSASKTKINTTTTRRTSSRITKKVTTAAPNLYQTPYHRNGTSSFEPVTPKICPNTPVNVLRRPRIGETVISMEGSPLLVTTTMNHDNVANINVPLNDGTVLSLLPSGDLRSSMIPNLSPSTINQIKTLKGYLEKFIP